MNILGYANPWTTFQNLAVPPRREPSVFLMPASASAADTGSTNSGTSLGTVNDANGTLTDLGMFESGAELFSQAEVGWSPTKDDRYTKNAKPHLLARRRA